MSAAKSRPPMPSTNEASSVRERVPSAPPTSTEVRSAPPPASGTGASSTSGSAGATRERLEAKLRTARAVLGTLPATDDRARLLHIAIVRRDEALLEGVLAALKNGNK
jgi:hypothetical protein